MTKDLPKIYSLNAIVYVELICKKEHYVNKYFPFPLTTNVVSEITIMIPPGDCHEHRRPRGSCV